MTRGMTTRITAKLPETVDVTQAYNIYATIDQSVVHYCKEGSDLTVEPHKISFRLSQQETLRLSIDETAKLQFNWTYNGGLRGGTKIAELAVKDNLERRVLA